MKESSSSSIWPDGHLDIVRERGLSPLLVTDATIHTRDPRIGTMRHADLLVRSGRIVGVGPGIINAAADPRPGSPTGSTVLTATGAAIIPMAVDLTQVAGLSGDDSSPLGSLAPGSPADFLVVSESDARLSTVELAKFLTLETPRIIAAFRAGWPVVWRGVALALPQGDATPVTPSVDDMIGTWVDETGFLEQTLTRDGRYHETRGGRELAFQGRYWMDGDRIDYHDDLGLWAYGTVEGDVLHHAGYAMRRRGA